MIQLRTALNVVRHQLRQLIEDTPSYGDLWAAERQETSAKSAGINGAPKTADIRGDCMTEYMCYSDETVP